MNAILSAVRVCAIEPNEVIVPGMTLPAQLGIASDTSWAPAAPVVILAEASTTMTGEKTYWGLAKNKHGGLVILCNMTIVRDETTDYQSGYCTAALYMDQLKRYLSSDNIDLIQNAMAQWKKDIETLPAYMEIFR